ncbi:MAG: hypothetical protein IT168_26725 [Bryobacterales bacterium]|nr:hypothetical protein [Bryobacterales bacterium]
MWTHPAGSRSGRDTRAWPLLLLLVIAILIPTVCVVWLLQDAARSQQAVARQMLSEAHRSQIALFRQALDAWWDKRLAAIDEMTVRSLPSAVFASIVRDGLADSALIHDTARRLSYPAPQSPPGPDAAADNAPWNRARALEDTDAAGAAAAYAKLGSDPILGARALQGQVRSLLRLGRREVAVGIVLEQFAGKRHDRAADLQGRLIAADLELLALRLIGNPEDARFQKLTARLIGRMDDYDNPAMSAPQRRFLASELRAVGVKDAPALDDAERVAARWVEQGPDTRLIVLRSPSGRVDLLLRRATVIRQIGEFAKSQRFPQGVQAAAQLRDSAAPGPILTETPAGPRFPDLRLVLWSAEADPAAALAERRTLAYFWTGLLVIALTAALALLVARAIQRQIRLARLKTDLVATVSHELKTPVASVCLLVDTLLDDARPDPAKTREYLELIARENARLSRMIDNFLTFSRMERDRKKFDFREVRPEAIVRAAVDAIGERFAAPQGCPVEVDIEPALPVIFADESGLVTTLTNLLDNAWKYSGDEKRITVRAYRERACVCFAVEDNGIGIPARETQKIFRRFYQVDQRLARERGGCGLGLSIVDFIVRAHGGSVKVASQVGRGSTFTVALPVAVQGVGA